jgi:hypothetical protein
LFIVQFLNFFAGGGSVCPGDSADLSQGWLGEYHVMLDTHLLYVPNVSQPGLELVAGSMGSPPVLSA